MKERGMLGMALCAGLVAAAGGAFCGCATPPSPAAGVGAPSGAPVEGVAPGTITMRPIGRVEVKDGKAAIRLDAAYADGLLGLDQWSHVQVLYWFDKNDTPEHRRVLRVHPRGNRENPLTGVFACRSPSRPNLLALTVCKIVAVEGNVVRLDKIDAFDGTPVLDLKPFTPADAPSEGVRVPDWARRGPGGRIDR